MRPGRTCGTWARRRAQLITLATAAVQRIGDFLSVAWPAVTETCAQPCESTTWLAAVQLVTSRCSEQPAGWLRWGRRRSLPRSGPRSGTGVARRRGAPISRRIFAALTDTEGVVAWSRRGMLRRVADELGDLQRIRAHPARIMRAGQPACTTWSERTRVTGARTARHDHHASRNSSMPSVTPLRSPAHATSRSLASPVAEPPGHEDHQNQRDNLSVPLDEPAAATSG